MGEDKKYKFKWNRKEGLRYFSDDTINLALLIIKEGKLEIIPEFKDEKQANGFKVPDWFDKEISTEITNADMATMTVDSIFEIISKYN